MNICLIIVKSKKFDQQTTVYLIKVVKFNII